MSRSPQLQPRSPILFVVCVSLGVVFGSIVVYRATNTLPDLRGGARTQAVDTDWGKNRPSKPVIEFDGQRFICSGGGNRSAQRGDWVAYDASDPSRCRLESDVGVITSQDKVGVAFGVVLFILLTALGVVQPGRKPVAAPQR